MDYNKVWYTTREKQYFLEELEEIKWAIDKETSDTTAAIDDLKCALMEVLWSNTRPNSDFQKTNREDLHKLIDTITTSSEVSVVLTDWTTGNQQRFYFNTTENKQPIERNEG